MWLWIWREDKCIFEGWMFGSARMFAIEGGVAPEAASDDVVVLGFALTRSMLANWSLQTPFSTSMNPATAADLFITAYAATGIALPQSWIAAWGSW